MLFDDVKKTVPNNIHKRILSISFCVHGSFSFIGIIILLRSNLNGYKFLRKLIRYKQRTFIE